MATRYLLNDASVLANRPLVYGSALRTYGQVTVYHYKPSTTAAAAESDDEWSQYGPCYRCINPRAIAQAAAGNCSDDGVVGPGMRVRASEKEESAGRLRTKARRLTHRSRVTVTSIIGSIQAMEVMKMVTKDKGISPLPCCHRRVTCSRTNDIELGLGLAGVLDARMLLVDASLPSFHIMKLRKRREDCSVCGRNPSITRENFSSPEAIDGYMKKCLPSALALLDHSHRITVAVRLKRQSYRERSMSITDPSASWSRRPTPRSCTPTRTTC